jgi:CBS domain-containing protein
MKSINVLAAKRLGITHCQGEMSLFDVAQLMDEEDISSVVVLDEEGYLRGIITRTDVVQMALEHPDTWQEISCCTAMTSDVVTAEVDSSLEHVARLLQQKHIHRVVIVEKEEGGKLRPLAVISDHDIIYHLVHHGR